MFKLIKKQGSARRGEFTTSHGTIQTPVFMNVATQAAIKGAVSSDDLKAVGCQVALSNTYHLHVRPGDELIRSLGGLHAFMNWDGPLLTDSGGFQIFSLASLRKITEEGAAFSSHVDGRKFFMSPEDSIRIQANLGSDIVMAFDECIEIPAPHSYVQESCDRTYRWLVRCKDELERLSSNRASPLSGTMAHAQFLFGINQGATFPDMRVSHMKRIADLDLPGYAIGGLAVGETTEQMYETVEVVEAHMPEHRPRYLMGVGTPQNIIEAVARGIDFFDCVMPARNGRHGRLFTWDENGSININNERFKDDNSPIDSECGCPVCQSYSRAYIRHLFKSGEMLAMRLAVLHNLYYYNTLMSKIRSAIDNGTFTGGR
ncbi:MAG: tRNA guanosine(34) transglycosylase Tgt [Oscillospiraceae bacterium]|nr:tRNA guanosine(34) transglycosylase Tgt [Oscillospiraceae bacterium]